MYAPVAKPIWRRRYLSRAIVVGAIITLTIPSIASRASAHTFFAGSDPPDGAALDRAPRTVQLDFSSDVDPRLTRVQLTDGAGHTIPVSGVIADETRPTRLDVGLPLLPPEAYRLSFATRDPVDLHETAGSIVFGVATVPNLSPTRPTPGGPDIFEVLLRWLARSGLMVLLGSVIVLLLVLPERLPERLLGRLQRRLLALALIGAGSAAAGDTALFCFQSAQVGPFVPTFSRLVGQSEFGRRWVITMQFGVATVLLLWWLRRKTDRGRSLRHLHPLLGRKGQRGQSLTALTVGLLACAQAVAVGASGHTGAAASPTPVGLALRGAHLLAVGAWIGAVVTFAVILIELRRLPEPLRTAAVEYRPALLQRFSPVAACGLVAVVITGLLLSGGEVATVTALLSTKYGAILVVKSALVLAVALIGLHHGRLIRRRGEDPNLDGHLRRTVPLEALAGLMAVMLGAGLAATAPARGPQFGPQPMPHPSTVTVTSADLVIRVSLQPNKPGRNLLSVDVHNTRRPAPAPITEVLVRLRTPALLQGSVVTTTRVTDSHWDGGAVNLAPGATGLDVSVERPGQLPAASSVPWSVNGPDLWHQRTVLSNAPLSPLATGAAGGLAVAAVAGLLATRWPRLRRRSGGTTRSRPSFAR